MRAYSIQNVATKTDARPEAAPGASPGPGWAVREERSQSRPPRAPPAPTFVSAPPASPPTQRTSWGVPPPPDDPESRLSRNAATAAARPVSTRAAVTLNAGRAAPRHGRGHAPSRGGGAQGRELVLAAPALLRKWAIEDRLAMIERVCEEEEKGSGARVVRAVENCVSVSSECPLLT